MTPPPVRQAAPTPTNGVHSAQSSSPVGEVEERARFLVRHGAAVKAAAVGVAGAVAFVVGVAWRARGELDGYARKADVESAITPLVTRQEAAAASSASDHDRITKLEARWEEIQRSLERIDKGVAELSRRQGGSP